MHEIREILSHSVLITLFVFIMMVIVDYANVLFKKGLNPGKNRRAVMYFSASLLGVLPGCLGSFAAVSMYERGALSLGALSAVMIATSGDEAFVMLSLFPGKAVILFAFLFFLAFFSGYIADFIFDKVLKIKCSRCEAADISGHGPECRKPGWGEIKRSLAKMSFSRFLVFSILLAAFYMEAAGIIGGEHKPWMRISFLSLTAVSFFISLTVPDHYLEEHIYRHIIRKHLGRVFLWTLGAMLLLHFATKSVNFGAFVKGNPAFIILLGTLLGIIPESGPNLLFVFLYAKGMVPFSVLLANSIAQDGHGMLPLFAFSLRDSLLVKVANILIALAAGYIFLFLGY